MKGGHWKLLLYDTKVKGSCSFIFINQIFQSDKTIAHESHGPLTWRFRTFHLRKHEDYDVIFSKINRQNISVRCLN